MSHADYIHCEKCGAKAIYAPDYEGDAVVFCASCKPSISGIADPAEAIKAAREAIGNLFIEIDHMTNGAGFPRKAVMDHARRALALLTHR